jgi:peptidoglycan hydrolase-like protein with peptidoglycan-binding domain
MAIDTRRVQPQNHDEVRDQLADMQRRIDGSGMLRMGAQGDAVADLQRRLKSFGFYDAPVDGDFGAVTDRAVRAFQREAGIVVDGSVGDQTVRAMIEKTMFVEDNFETVGSKGQRGGDVRRAERILQDLGMNPGTVDGKFDQATADAVGRFKAGDPTLAPNQRIGARAFAAMRAEASQPLSVGDRTPGVKQLEANLKKLGINPGTVDNRFTENTANAVRTFQQRNNLPATGVADPATRAKIQKAADRVLPPAAQQIEQFSRTEPRHDYTRVSVDGQTVNVRTREMLQRAEFIMRNKFGHEGFDFGVVQGSYTSAVSQSGGTHDRGGAMDLHTRTLPRGTVDDMVKSLRMAGFAAWSRGRGFDNFDPHIHAIAIGDRELSTQARNQVSEYFAGGDGLVGSTPDPDRGLGRDSLIPQWARR